MRERESGRERERYTDRQTDRQTDTKRTDRERGRGRQRDTERYMGDTRKEVICFLGAHVPTRIYTLSPLPLPAICLVLKFIYLLDFSHVTVLVNICNIGGINTQSALEIRNASTTKT